MIALRLLLGKTGNSSSRLLIDQLQSQLAAQSAYILAQQERQRQPAPEDYATLHDRIDQLEARLAESESQLAASITAHAQAKAHIAALQHQRTQLLLELEQMEDGFQVELSKVSGELSSWERDMIGINDHPKDWVTAPTPPSPSQPHSRSSSSTSSPPRAAILNASLERAKSATRIWALEDEVDRVRHERDALRRRLDTGRASLMQLKRQASEVQVRLGRGRERGLNKSESNLLKADSGRSKGMGMSTRASDMQLNTRIRPAMRGEPLTPETSDDNRSIEMNM
ncbi:hypothetical protein FRC06_008664 [Ceratobasidium sp. 370]|nr:hypothetical protein FRC06_008664 [Ceratobasidium sp. 370]